MKLAFDFWHNSKKAYRLDLHHPWWTVEIHNIGRILKSNRKKNNPEFPSFQG